MKQINVLGQKWVHKYQRLLLDGTPTNDLLEVECTKTDYEALATSTPPERAGYKWVASVERFKFDSPSGDLEDDTYTDITARMVKLAGLNPATFDTTVNKQHGLSKSDTDMIDPVVFGEIWVVKEKEKL